MDIRKYKQHVIELAVLLLWAFLFVFFFLFTQADRRTMLSPSQSISVNGMSRTFRVYSTHIDQSEPVTVILALHQLGGNGREIAYYSAMHNDIKENTVIIYPDAISPQKEERRGWNADFCCGSGWEQQADDKRFIETLITIYTDEYKTKNNKVFLVGFSNGAIFAHKLASEIPEKIAGIAAISGSVSANDKEHRPKQAVPTLLMHGLHDQTIPVNGGPSIGDASFNWKPLSYTEAMWKKANQCSDTLRNETEVYTETVYSNCTSPLVVRIDRNIAHEWADWRLFELWNRHSEGSKYILDFIYSLE